MRLRTTRYTLALYILHLGISARLNCLHNCRICRWTSYADFFQCSDKCSIIEATRRRLYHFLYLQRIRFPMTPLLRYRNITLFYHYNTLYLLPTGPHTIRFGTTPHCLSLLCTLSLHIHRHYYRFTHFQLRGHSAIPNQLIQSPIYLINIRWKAFDESRADTLVSLLRVRTNLFLTPVPRHYLNIQFFLTIVRNLSLGIL